MRQSEVASEGQQAKLVVAKPLPSQTTERNSLSSSSTAIARNSSPSAPCALVNSNCRQMQPVFISIAIRRLINYSVHPLRWTHATCGNDEPTTATDDGIAAAAAVIAAAVAALVAATFAQQTLQSMSEGVTVYSSTGQAGRQAAIRQPPSM